MSRSSLIGWLGRGLLALFLAVLAIRTHSANAGDIIDVDTTDDDPAKTVCSAAANDCSLRGAITTTNASVLMETINLQAATYVLDETSTNENLNVNGDLDITDHLIINGNGATINANGIDRPMEIFIPSLVANPVVRLNDLTLTEGLAEFGGGLSVLGGEAVLDNVTVTNNTVDGSGGGIFVDGDADLNMMSSTVSFNKSNFEFGGGGGLRKADGTGSYSVTNSEFLNNDADGAGGGAYMGASPAGSFADTDFIENMASQGGGGLLTAQHSVTINGGVFEGNDAGNQGGGLRADGGAEASGVTFINNTAVISGGGVSIGGGHLVDVIVTGNSAQFGGGIHTSAADISFATISGNMATVAGGGVNADGSQIVVDHSAITDNQSAGSGGGIRLVGGTPSITNSTISGNTASIAGGGISRLDFGIPFAGVFPQGGDPPGPASLSFLTIADNTAPQGANVSNPNVVDAARLEIRGSIVADPVTGPNCSGLVVSLGFNIEDSDTCSLDDSTDLTGEDPMLSPLAANGGATQTHALPQGSPAVDFVDTGCPPPDDDQRGGAVGPRPQGTACDAGAYESGFGATPSATPVATPTPSASPTPTGAATPTPTPTPTGGGQQVAWGDHNCSTSVDPVDGLFNLRHDAGLPTDTGNCPDMGDDVNVQGDGTHPWGDLDCSGVADPVDGLKVLRFDAGLDVARPNDCPDPGEAVTIS